MNKRGNFMMGVYIILVMLIVFGAVMIFYYAWSLAGPIIQDLGQEVSNEIIKATGNETANNLSESATVAFGSARTSLGILQTVTILFFFVMILGFIIMAFFVRSYPFLLFVWIIGIIILVFVSIFLSASYEELKSTDGYLREVYASWGMNDFILSNLPAIFSIIGAMGALVMLFVLSQDQDIETGGVGI